MYVYVIMLLYFEDFYIVPEADRYPIRVSSGPLHLVDLTLGHVGQDGYLHWLWHLLYVPDQSLVIVSWGQEEMVCQEEKHVKGRSVEEGGIC